MATRDKFFQQVKLEKNLGVKGFDLGNVVEGACRGCKEASQNTSHKHKRKRK